MADEPVIVEAVAAAVGRSGQGSDPALAKRIEAAMSQAVLDANADGISMDDVETIKARMMDARARVLAEARG